MKKKIFISVHYLHLGGVERSLIALLNTLPREKYSIDLFVYQHTGELMKDIPQHINLLPQIDYYAAIEKPLKEVLFSNSWRIAKARLVAKWKHWKHCRNKDVGDDVSIFQYIYNEVTPLLPSLKKYGKYDLAISYLMPHNIVLEKVNAEKKWAWLHTDYSFVYINKELECAVWEGFDKIISISDSVGEAFKSLFPKLEDKLLRIDNFLDVDFIRESSTKGVPIEIDNNNEITFLSVGRYSYQKNFDNIPWICKELHNMGLQIKWYIIGFGEDEELIKNEISKANMKSNVFLLGKKENPYPYMKACHFYIQPSRYEGKAITVQEAQILYKPTIITNYPTASSQIIDGVDGVIVPLENQLAAKKINEVIKNVELQEQLVINLKQKEYNKLQIELFEKMV